MPEFNGNFEADPKSTIRVMVADILMAIRRGNCSGEQLLAASELVTKAARILEKGVTMESVNG